MVMNGSYMSVHAACEWLAYHCAYLCGCGLAYIRRMWVGIRYTP